MQLPKKEKVRSGKLVNKVAGSVDLASDGSLYFAQYRGRRTSSSENFDMMLVSPFRKLHTSIRGWSFAQQPNNGEMACAGVFSRHHVSSWWVNAPYARGAQTERLTGQHSTV